MNIMEQYGARAARQRMALSDKIPSLSSMWEPGDYFVMVFPAQKIGGVVDFPVGERYGHELNLPKTSTFKQSFVCTTVTEVDDKLVPKGHDFLSRLAGLSYAIKKGTRERQVLQDKAFTPNEEAHATAVKKIDEGMKNIKPIVGHRKSKVVVEGFFAKLDSNHRLKDDKMDFKQFHYGISPTKFTDLLTLADKQGVYIDGNKYFYIVMETDPTKEKEDAGKAPWKVASAKLEDLYPDFQNYMNNLMASSNITKETIEGHFFNFREYDKNELLSAIASAMKPELSNLRALDNTTYFDFAQEEYIVEALEEVELTADAELIKALVAESKSKEDAENLVGNIEAVEQQTANSEPVAQSLNIQTQEATAQTVTTSEPVAPTAPTAPTAPVPPTTTQTV